MIVGPVQILIIYSFFQNEKKNTILILKFHGLETSIEKVSFLW